jgi:hypothetical protein
MRNKTNLTWLALLSLIIGLFLITGTALAATSTSSTKKATAAETAAKAKADKEADLKTDAPLDFTIGVPGKTGCLVCHGDPKLRNVKTTANLYIDQFEIMGSVHKDLACTKCHTDFSTVNASQSHQGLTGNSRIVAGLACKNCHQHSPQLKIYDRSVHGRLALGGFEGAATCGDCHGSHGIKSFKKDAAYKQAFKMNGKQVCGRSQCHKDFYDSYNDYYHGAAYKTGAPNAPACWDCHGFHQILPSADTESMVAKSNLAKTCGVCHPDSRASFTTYAELIHQQKKVAGKNIVIKYKNKLIDWVKKTF